MGLISSTLALIGNNFKPTFTLYINARGPKSYSQHIKHAFFMKFLAVRLFS